MPGQLALPFPDLDLPVRGEVDPIAAAHYHDLTAMTCLDCNDDGFFCTRPAGHDRGPHPLHVACGTGHIAVAVWS